MHRALALATILPLTAVSAVMPECMPQIPPPVTNIFHETASDKAQRLAWWTNDRFGLFIHFGLYALNSRGSWFKSQRQITTEAYDARYLPVFDPDLLDVREWARIAKATGMKYVVLTAKHHEGFCLWDSDLTDYKITNTAYRRDLVKEFVEACRAEGLKVGLYYSVIDWHHPDYTIDCNHPQHPPADRQTQAEYDRLNANRDMRRYRQYMFGQVRELLTRYGKIDIVWYDYTIRWKFGKTWQDWDAIELVKMTRELQPGIILNSRLDLMDTEDGWDFVTPEQVNVESWPTVRGQRVPWEVCQTFSGTWGHNRDEMTWKSPAQLIELLSGTVAKGGNLILNVGPTGRGEFDGRARGRLAEIASWMHGNARSIYGCTAAPDAFRAPNGTGLTYNPKTNRLYLHLYDYPMGRLPLDFWERIAYAQFLHEASEVPVYEPPFENPQSGDLVHPKGGLDLPVVKPDVVVPVVEIFLK